MKLAVGTIIIAVSAAAAVAQDEVKGARQAEEIRAKIVAELASTHHTQAVKNSPFTADEVNESVQTLADGNRIVRSSTGKIYRNSDGRVRRDTSGGVGGMLGTTYSVANGVSILNPNLGQKYLLDSKLKTAKVIELTQAQKELAIVSGKMAAERAVADQDRSQATRKLRTELETKLRATSPSVVAGTVSGNYAAAITAAGQGGVLTYAAVPTGKYETRTEELGTRVFEGVSAEGTRKITTIPAGAIGNERAIEIVYERWFSKELGMVVFSRNSDPRFGEQTYKLTNLLRTEPDPSLFSIPTEYRRTGTPGTVYRISTPAERPVAVRPVASARPVLTAAPAPKAKPQN